MAWAINTVAGGGSMLTVPLLVLAGVPGNAANGSNRVGILTSNVAAVATFRRLGVDGLRHASRVVVPVVLGGLIGSFAVGRLLDDAAFERVFGLLMIPLVILSVRRPSNASGDRAWSTTKVVIVFLLIGIYGGAFQAGVGLVLLAALTRSGFDLVMSNSIKVIVNTAVTVVALPVFILSGDIAWAPALVLAAGFVVGGWLGAQASFRGGEVLIRRVMVVAALGLAGRLIGIY
ncbi:MAG: sulfite exporter TauE/SafE family protein [Actinomycetota bacterium]|nr:sulfite exporter TauE/SafE family protein [Actinomycetota bacterium]